MPATGTVDPYRLMHWLNVRKLTPTMLAERVGLAPDDLYAILADEGGSADATLVTRFADALDVSPGQLGRDDAVVCSVIHRSAAELADTGRAVNRDGIHFYDYFTLPSPRGSVAPVVLAIHCPAGRLPALNNGHLEPAITVNLGPGDIHGRWAEDLDDASWAVLAANRGPEYPWVIGDSYVEPSFCPHSYSLATDEPARIVSYTGTSNLRGLVDAVNRWPDPAFDRLAAHLDRAPAAAALSAALDRRGLDAVSVAALTRVPRDRVAAYLAGDEHALSIADLRCIASYAGFDYRSVLVPDTRHDALGKTCATVADSVAGIRRFRSYTVAPMASSPSLSDLSGLFVLVTEESGHGLDLCEAGSTHYLVTAGSVGMRWIEPDGTEASRSLQADDSVWLAPFVPHGFTGSGSLARFGNGDGYSYLDQIELANTYRPVDTVQRARRDRLGWGYDDKAGQR